MNPGNPPGSLLPYAQPREFADPFWRWSHLYRIITDDSREVAFRPNPEQVEMWRSLWYRLLILKARQLGYSTAVCLLFLDQCLWRPNTAAAVIADTRENASRIFRTKVVYPYEQLPELLREMPGVRTVKQTETELVFANNSSFSVSTSVRSGTINLLLVSEAGKIARRYPEKMSEIVTGSFEAVPQNGTIIVESTAEGRDGWFADACLDALRREQQNPGRKLAPLEWRLLFAPWWRKAAYRSDPSITPIDDELRTYFRDTLAKRGIRLDAEQQAWYAFKRATLGALIGKEHPSYPEEAFAQAIEGVVYAEQLARARKAGRIGRVSLRPELPVNTFWDFGLRDHNAVWCHQEYGTEHRFVYCIGGAGHGLAHWWTKLETWRIAHGLRWGKHYLPHDAEKRIEGRSGDTSDIYTKRDILVELGMADADIIIVPRVLDISTGIDLTRQAFTDYAFDEEGCTEGIAMLDAYRYEWDETLGCWSRKPRHDTASNYADALRQHAQGYRRNDGTTLPRPREVLVGYSNGSY